MGVFVKSRHFSAINHVLWSFKSDSHDLKFLVCVVLNISNKKSMPTKKSMTTVIMLGIVYTSTRRGGSEPVNFWFISGEIPADFFLENFYSTKRFVFEFQGESLELLLSYLAHFRRYHHFRGFWQSPDSSYRDC